MGVNQYIKQEMARLQDENETLRDEVDSLRHYIDAIKTLLEAVNALDPSAEIMPLLGTLLFNAMSVINAQAGSLLLLDDDTQELVFVLVRGTAAEQLKGQRMPSDKGIAGWVVQNARPTIVNNTRTDDRFYAQIDQATHFTTNSILAAPITGNNKVMGVIEVVNKYDGKPFNETDEILLTLLCRFAGDFLFRIESENG